MGTYYQSSTDDLSGHGIAEHNKRLATTTGGSATLTASAASSQFISTAEFQFITASGDPGLSNASGAWNGDLAAQLDVTAAGTSLTYQVNWNSISTAGGYGGAIAQSEAHFTGTGLKLATAPGATWQSAVSDTHRFTMYVGVANSNMMSAESITVRVNTVDSYVMVPWTVGAPAPDTYYESRRIKTVLQAVNRASTY